MSSLFKLSLMWAIKIKKSLIRQYNDRQLTKTLKSRIEGSKFLNAPISPKKYSKKAIAFLIPPYAKGQGGHETIFRMVSAAPNEIDIVILIDTDQVNLDVQRTLIQAKINRKITIDFANKFFEVQFTKIVTSNWITFKLAARHWNLDDIIYFVQDFEPYFYPVGDLYFEALNTYESAKKIITAGNWLKNEVSQYGCDNVNSIELGVSHSDYFLRQDLSRENQIAIYFRPSTDRRLPFLLIEAIALCSQDPDISCYTFALFGCADDYGLSSTYNVKHCGILEHKSLNTLYNTSKLGVVLSATNYSLVNLEMAACGLPFIDLSTKNVSDTFPDEIYFPAKPNATALYKAIKEALASETNLKTKARNALLYANSKDWDHQCGKFWNYIQ